MESQVKPYTGCQYIGCKNNATKQVLTATGRKTYRCDKHAKPQKPAGSKK